MVGNTSPQPKLTYIFFIHSAGISGELNGPPEKAEDADIKKFLQIMDVNVTGVLLGLKYASRSMKKNTAEEWRSIIMTSSVAGLTGSPAVPWGYTASKCGLINEGGMS